jgi:hypothetical protein
VDPLTPPYNQAFKPESLYTSGLKPTIEILGAFDPRAKARGYAYVF